MAYFTGTANNPADLLGKLRINAQSIGWSTDRSSADEWCCHNAQGYWSFKAFNNMMGLCGNTGFNNAKAWALQPGTSNSQENGDSNKYFTQCQLSANPFVAWHLFATLDYLHLVIEIDSGKFRHLHIGTLDKLGAQYTGGQYVCGNYFYSTTNSYYYRLGSSYCCLPFCSMDNYSYASYASRVRCDEHDLWDIAAPKWLYFSPNYNETTALGLGRGYYSGSRHPSSQLVQCSANPLTGGTLLIPCTIYTQGAEGRTRLIGEVKDFRVCRMDYLAPGDTVTVGSEQWRVFPAFERTASDDTGSGMVGYAYRVVA